MNEKYDTSPRIRTGADAGASVRVCIVCAYFEEELPYQEVHIANALDRMGHRVWVLAARQRMSTLRRNGQTYRVGWHASERGYPVYRLPTFRVRGSFYLCAPFPHLVRQIDPDLMILFGPAQGHTMLPVMFRGHKASCSVVTVFGDSASHRKDPNSLKGKLRDQFKRRLYTYAARKSRHLYLTHPEARHQLAHLLGSDVFQSIAEGIVDGSLGYDGGRFHFDMPGRNELRREWGVGEDEVVFALCGRWHRAKKLDEALRVFEELHRSGARFKLVITGLLSGSDPVYCQEIIGLIDRLKVGDDVIKLPLVGQDDLRRVYSASDVAFWYDKTSITVLQALGTGAYLVLPREERVAHICTDETIGRYFPPGDRGALLSVLGEVLFDIQSIRRGREVRVHSALERFSYDALVAKLLEACLNQRRQLSAKALPSRSSFSG